MSDLHRRLGLHPEEPLTDVRPAPWHQCQRCFTVYLPATTYPKTDADVAPFPWSTTTESPTAPFLHAVPEHYRKLCGGCLRERDKARDEELSP